MKKKTLREMSETDLKAAMMDIILANNRNAEKLNILHAELKRRRGELVETDGSNANTDGTAVTRTDS